MPFTKKMIQQLQKPSLKAFAFNGEPSPEEITLLDEYFWDFPNKESFTRRDRAIFSPTKSDKNIRYEFSHEFA